MSEFDMAAAAPLDAYPGAAATMTEAGGGWFGAAMAGKAARPSLGSLRMTRLLGPPPAGEAG